VERETLRSRQLRRETETGDKSLKQEEFPWGACCPLSRLSPSHKDMLASQAFQTRYIKERCAEVLSWS